MADRRRIVTLSPGGRPVADVDLETGSSYLAIRDTFAYAPGAQNQQASREPGQYGGQVVVGEQNDNGTIAWQALVKGATADVVAGNIETLLAAVSRNTRDRLFEWRPDGATYSSYFQVAGPAQWKPTYKWAQWSGAQSMIVDVSVPVRPLVLWDQPRIGDPFDTNSLADYTFDAASSADVNVSSGLRPVVGAALTVERAARHTVRGYTFLEGQSTVRATPSSTITGFKAGVRLRASATTFVEVYVDDNGTNSRLRTDVVIGGTRTNRASVNLSSRIANGDLVWVRGRIEGQTVYAEHFSAVATVPTPLAAPTTVAPSGGAGYTLTSPEQSGLPAGHSGWSWIPQHANATINMFAFDPWTYRNRALPDTFTPLDVIPGTASALASVDITHSGGSNAPKWAMIAWALTPAGFPVGLPAIVEAETGSLSGWASSTQSGARGGTDVRLTAAGAVSASATLSLPNGAVLQPDDFTDGTVDLEVWARAVVSAGLVNPRLAAAVGFVLGTPSIDLPDGRALTKPSSGTVYRFVRLGVIPADAQVGGNASVKVTGLADTGSTGPFGLDYVIVVPARRRAAVMTGVDTGDVNSFFLGTLESRKRISPDLSTTLAWMSSPLNVERDASIGGALMYPTPGRATWLVKISSLVPDDPSAGTGSEQTAHQCTVTFDIVPRSYMLRSG